MYLNTEIKENINTYLSEDKIKKAIVVNNYGILEVQYFNNDELIAIESYQEHSLHYHQDAAENYVLGVKHF